MTPEQFDTFLKSLPQPTTPLITTSCDRIRVDGVEVGPAVSARKELQCIARWLEAAYNQLP